MLIITQINYIRYLHFEEGKKITQIYRMTETNYHTIKKYLDMQDLNEKKLEAKRPNKSDMLRSIISRWIKEDQTRHHKQRHTASRIYDRLADEHSDILEVSERTVRKLVKEEKEKVFGGHVFVNLKVVHFSIYNQLKIGPAIQI